MDSRATTRADRPGRRVRPTSAALVMPLVALPLLLTACGSGGVAGTTSGGGLALAPHALCQTLTGVFANGPDPDVDPVGYALSQILPLTNLHSPDTAAVDTVNDVVAADRALVRSNGSDRAAKAAIKKDEARLNQACPGVTS